ncbi:MAG: amidohydrolase family protein [Verrucomicrobia bacterium]|nr:amidohydrolase family protein [Verrucomicrobiota bacterium]
MNAASHQVLRARLVVPVSLPPIADGALVLCDGVVAAVGFWRDVARHWTGPIADLGEVVVFPGLVNAHCHLDYTGLAGQIAPTASFTDWIKSITSLKGQWTSEDFARSWRAGAEMLLAGGVTTVGDIEAVPELLPEVWETTPLRVTSFLELTGVRSRVDPRAILHDAVTRAGSLRHGRSRGALSPHAPYSTVPELLRRVAEVANGRRWPVSIHVSESAEEFEMFLDARGPMYDWVARNQRDMSDCGGVTPVRHLARCGLLGSNLLAIHANYLDAEDVALLAGSGVSVAHCPRSHAYFGHRPFPFPSLERAGVNLCLGTDSLVTVERLREPLRLDLLAEARAFLAAHPGVSPSALLRMMTVNGARALGLGGRVGELAPGAAADLLALPFSGPAGAAAETLLHHVGSIPAVMIGGRWERNEIPAA